MHIKWIHTSDTHGALAAQDGQCSLSSIPGYVHSLSDDVILTDGGGCLLTKGAGIPSSELPARIIGISPKGLRNYLIEFLKREKAVTPSIVSNWRFIPEEWTFAALRRDRDIIFPR